MGAQNTSTVNAAGDPATLVVENDTLLAKDILGYTLSGGDTIMSQIVVQSAIEDAYGSHYATGGYFGTVMIGDRAYRSRGLYDYFAVKFYPSGEIAWVNICASIGNDIGHSIVVDGYGNTHVAGIFDDSTFLFYSFPRLHQGRSSTDGILYSYDFLGTPRMPKIIASGPGVDGAYAVTVDKWNNIYVAGTFSDSAIVGGVRRFAQGKGDLFLVKLDRERNFLFTRTYGTPWGDERGVALTIGDITGQVNVIYDYNVLGTNRYHIWYDDYGRVDDPKAEICMACLDQALQEQLRKK